MRIFGKRRSKRAIFGTLTLLIVGLVATVAFAGSTGYYSWYPHQGGGHGNHKHYKPKPYTKSP